MIISADFTEDNEFKHALVKSSLFQIGIIIDVRIIFFIFLFEKFNYLKVFKILCLQLRKLE